MGRSYRGFVSALTRWYKETPRSTIAMLLARSCAIALFVCGTGLAQSRLPPETILVKGKILTMDSRDSIAEAVAIDGGKIVAVGTTESIEALAGEGTRRIDLAGRTATPGLIDSHNHFAVGAADALYSLDLAYPNVTVIADVVAKVRERVREIPPGEWILGSKWDEGKLKENRYLHAEDLDPVSPENPAWLTHTTAHYGVANSHALRLAKITRDTPDPEGGVIDHYPDGTPTGVLKDTAMSLVARLVPDLTVAQLRAAIERYLPELNKEGLTAVKDPEIGSSIWEAYQSVLAEGKLTARVFVLWRAGPSMEDARELIERVGPFTKPWITRGDEVLISGGIKIYADGSGGARTAWVHDEWNTNLNEIDRGNYGVPRLEAAVLREQIQAFHEAGLHIGVHAVGDRAIDWVVDSYAQALEAKPVRGLRHSIIHCNIPTDHALDVMAKLQSTYDAGYPEVQPPFLWWLGDVYAGNFGPERNPRLLPLKRFQERNIRWGGGSDYDVTPFPPRYGLWASLVRETLIGRYGAHPFGTEQSVDIRSALRAYTIVNARQLFLEDRIGSIEVGKYADIAVWDRDLVSVPAEQIKEIRCELTLMNGEIVHRTPDTPITVARIH